MTVLGKRVEITLDSILFATDFSRTAEKAGLYVKSIARRYASEVHLVHVVDLSAAFNAPDAGICIDGFRQNGENNLQQAKMLLVSDGTRVATMLREAIDPTEEVLRVAKEKSVDLIVLGTKGHKGIARLAFGSMAEQIIHQAECPVITVGPDAKPPESGAFRRIVYATDFSPEAAKAATFALSFAQDSGAHIYLCHVLPEPGHHQQTDSQELTARYTAALQHLIPDIAREWCEPECVLEHGYAADGILLLAHRVKADLIVLGTRRISHWFSTHKTGIAYEVIRAASCPVLTVRG
jgi:nucleotide-binding universal stress UspA family protein